MKSCSKCGSEKPETEFWFNKRKNRYVAHCNACAAHLRQAWKERNAEKVKRENREWQLANPDRVKSAQQRWKSAHPGIAALRAREWREKNRERHDQNIKRNARRLKDAAYAAYGGYRCKCCGETIEAFLSIDHVNNDGAAHRKTFNRRKLYKWLEEQGYPPSFQVLCMNCNFGKARNGGICPHQRSEGSETRAQARRPEAIAGRSAEPLE